jgi:hypothetical protein
MVAAYRCRARRTEMEVWDKQPGLISYLLKQKNAVHKGLLGIVEKITV